MNKTFTQLSLACVFAATSLGAQAHDALFELTTPATSSAPGQFIVRFADDGKPLPYPAAKLTRAWGYSADGKTLNLTQTPADGFVQVSAPAEATLLALEFDNGFYSRSTQGTVNKPMNEVPGAVSAVWAKKTGKYLVQWNALAAKPVGLQLEIVPTSATPPKPGETITLQVLWEGKPIEGIKVSKSEHAAGEKTDANGRAIYKVDAGRNFVWAERRTKVSGDPRHDSLAVASNLIFVVN